MPRNTATSQNVHSTRTGTPSSVTCGCSLAALSFAIATADTVPAAMSRRERYVVTNGIRLFAAESGPRRGPLVLLLHGWPECWWSWRNQLPALGAAGYHTVAI